MESHVGSEAVADEWAFFPNDSGKPLAGCTESADTWHSSLLSPIAFRSHTCIVFWKTTEGRHFSRIFRSDICVSEGILASMWNGKLIALSPELCDDVGALTDSAVCSISSLRSLGGNSLQRKGFKSVRLHSLSFDSKSTGIKILQFSSKIAQ